MPWNYIDWSQAKENAESMYTTTNVQSVLITDRMWETTCKWLENAGAVVTKSENGSTGWGNYSNAPVTGITEYSTNSGATWTSKTDNNQKGTSTIWLLKTGHTEYTNKNNIYDLAGNLWEWTNSEYTSGSSNYVRRGGSYGDHGTDRPAVYRGNPSASAGNGYISFRVGLFIQ